jgi:hypothetical protein
MYSMGMQAVGRYSDGGKYGSTIGKGALVGRGATMGGRGYDRAYNGGPTMWV